MEGWSWAFALNLSAVGGLQLNDCKEKWQQIDGPLGGQRWRGKPWALCRGARGWGWSRSSLQGVGFLSCEPRLLCQGHAPCRSHLSGSLSRSSEASADPKCLRIILEFSAFVTHFCHLNKCSFPPPFFPFFSLISHLASCSEALTWQIWDKFHVFLMWFSDNLISGSLGLFLHPFSGWNGLGNGAEWVGSCVRKHFSNFDMLANHLEVLSKNANSDSVGLGGHLRFSISKKAPRWLWCCRSRDHTLWVLTLPEHENHLGELKNYQCPCSIPDPITQSLQEWDPDIGDLRVCVSNILQVILFWNQSWHPLDLD